MVGKTLQPPSTPSTHRTASDLIAASLASVPELQKNAWVSPLAFPLRGFSHLLGFRVLGVKVGIFCVTIQKNQPMIRKQNITDFHGTFSQKSVGFDELKADMGAMVCREWVFIWSFLLS